MALIKLLNFLQAMKPVSSYGLYKKPKENTSTLHQLSCMKKAKDSKCLRKLLISKIETLRKVLSQSLHVLSIMDKSKDFTLFVCYQTMNAS